MLTPNEANQLDRWLTTPPDHGEMSPDDHQEEEGDDDDTDD